MKCQEDTTKMYDEHLKMKNKISEVKIKLHRITSRLDPTEEISQLENVVIICTIQNGLTGRKNIEKN